MQELVTIENGELVTTSRKIAKHYDKRHADIIRAIENLEGSAEFTQRNYALSEYTDSTGRKCKQYTVTRDGCVRLIGKFTGMEAGLAMEKYIAEFNRMYKELQLQPQHLPRILTPGEVFEDYHRVAKLFNFEGNQALLSTNAATLKDTGVNFIESLGSPKLIAPIQEQTFIPTELGNMVEPNVNARHMNMLLKSVDLQTDTRDHKNNLKWELTDEGKKYGEYRDTGKVSGGTPVKQIHWYKSVVDVIQDELDFQD